MISRRSTRPFDDAPRTQSAARVLHPDASTKSSRRSSGASAASQQPRARRRARTAGPSPSVILRGVSLFQPAVLSARSPLPSPIPVFPPPSAPPSRWPRRRPRGRGTSSAWSSFPCSRVYLEFQAPFERHLVPETLWRASYPHGPQSVPTWTLPFLGIFIPPRHHPPRRTHPRERPRDPPRRRRPVPRRRPRVRRDQLHKKRRRRLPDPRTRRADVGPTARSPGRHTASQTAAPRALAT